MIGTMQEAKEIFNACGDQFEPDIIPPGWTRLGTGGTRQVYLSPSGVCYKICHSYEDDEPSHNDREHQNFNQIRMSGRLPRGWKVPRSQLHAFRANFTRWDYKSRQPHIQECRVSVLACDYVPGEKLGGWDDISEEDWFAMEDAFAQVGLCDTGGANAVKSVDGYYIIDAGEDMLTGDN